MFPSIPITGSANQRWKKHYLNFDMARIDDELLEKHDLVSE